MDSATFALPTLATAAMARQDQIDLITNQAAAVIISSYLNHLNELVRLSPVNPNVSANLHVVSPAELVTLINDVQGALRTVP